jgi:hypothetical protein
VNEIAPLVAVKTRSRFQCRSATVGGFGTPRFYATVSPR